VSKATDDIAAIKALLVQMHTRLDVAEEVVRALIATHPDRAAVKAGLLYLIEHRKDNLREHGFRQDRSPEAIADLNQKADHFLKDWLASLQ